ncbi:MAG: DeoR/GlpR family DNA-binding transcription regulator [Treponema sp.]|nr:DeoR/GlpR family DNA-binding transcription regulator [Treponema sp.]MCL2273129.1 DeoR/GlpR family DNA-binding transcription regulator [Treponema sp.]
MKDRTIRILDIISSHKSIKVNLLAEFLDVSNTTLRKDLDQLEKRGIVKRTHGYASLEGADDTGKRMAVNHLIKQKIAKAAAQIVEDGETIMLESGSCCAMFAEELANTRKNVTIITNSVFIANHISRKNIRIILLGGYFLPESQVLVGPMTVKCCEIFFSQKYFLGTNGFIPDYGFTGRDLLRTETSTELAKHAKSIYMLTNAQKFKERGAYNLIQFDRISGVFTDDSISKEAESVLTKNNIRLYKVPSAEEKLQWRQFSGQPPILFTEK